MPYPFPRTGTLDGPAASTPHQKGTSARGRFLLAAGHGEVEIPLAEVPGPSTDHRCYQ